MTRINLLPHREERRKAGRKHFVVVAATRAVLALDPFCLVHGVFFGYLQIQNERNDFLKKENARLDKEIEEIKKLKDEIAALLSRKQVIETLQADRAQTVYLLDQLVKQMPEGVYLRSITQKGLRVSLVGYAQSNARVSTLMRNIEASPWLEAPKLNEIRATTVNNKRVSEFALDLSLKRTQPSAESTKGAAKPPAAAPVPAAKPG